VTSWGFDDGTRVIRPESASALPNPWAGKLVVPGVATVTATVQGSRASHTHSATLSIPVGIRARGWTNPSVPTPSVTRAKCEAYSRDCPVLYPPDSTHHLGSTVPDYSVSYARAPIALGPNAGYRFIPGERFFIELRSVKIFLNELMFDAEDPYYDDPLYPERAECDVAAFAADVTAHENRHVQYLTEFLADNRVAVAAEALVRFDASAEGAAWIDRQVDDLFRWIWDGADGSHTSREWPPTEVPLCFEGLKRRSAQTP
jgi:hypothetical protein